MSNQSKNKDKPEETKISKVLPPSGLAEDVLGYRTDASMTSDQQSLTNPERIYDFADSLSGEDTIQQQKKEKLETWVIFSLGGDFYGLPVSHVQEILRVTGITSVPHAPHPVRGVTNMRGKVLPVVDLRKRLDLVEVDIDCHSRILVVTSRERLIGLLVDSVQQVIRLARSHIQPPPPDVMTTQSDYILGVYHLQNKLVILFDVEQIFVIKDSLQESHKTAIMSESNLTGEQQ
ncbi:purine-binding chemotaxis protein CheW [bacterium]|nr:purine-binding chemotaxis protein CheW [bacterium]